MRARAPLGRGYLRLWVASGVSNLGDGVDIVALPLLAATLTRDPVVFAGVTLAGRLPWLLVALHAGVLIDRVDRRSLISVVNLSRGVLVGALGIAVILGETTVPLLYAVAFLLGVGEVIADTALQVLLPSVVRKDQLERANGRLFGAEIVANQFAGPALGGLLFAAAAASPMLFDAGTFVAGALLVLSIRGSFRPARETGERRPVRLQIAEGLRWLWRHRLIRTLALLGAVMNGVWIAGFSILALFSLEVLHIGESGFGLLIGASGIGYLGGSFGAERFLRVVSKPVALIGAALSLVIVALAMSITSSPWLIGASLLLYGFASAQWDVVAVTLRQTDTPDQLFGRVNSAYRFIQWGSMPLGALAGGALADAFGLRAPWIWGGVAVLAALLMSLRALAATPPSAPEPAS